MVQCVYKLNQMKPTETNFGYKGLTIKSLPISPKEEEDLDPNLSMFPHGRFSPYERLVTLFREGMSASDLAAKTEITNFEGIINEGIMLHDMSHPIITAYLEALGISGIRMTSFINEILVSTINIKLWKGMPDEMVEGLKSAISEENILDFFSEKYDIAITEADINNFIETETDESGNLKYNPDDKNIFEAIYKVKKSLAERNPELKTVVSKLQELRKKIEELINLIKLNDPETTEKWKTSTPRSILTPNKATAFEQLLQSIKSQELENKNLNSETSVLQKDNVDLFNKINNYEWIVFFLEGKFKDFYTIETIFENQEIRIFKGIETIKRYLNQKYTKGNFNLLPEKEKIAFAKQVFDEKFIKYLKSAIKTLTKKFNKTLVEEISIKYGISPEAIPENLRTASKKVVVEINLIISQLPKNIA